MAAVVVDIAEAIVAQLNGGTFSQPFTAVRKYAPVFDLAEMDTLHVTVVPHADTETRFDRDTFQEDYSIDIGVQKRVDMTEAALDAMVLLTQEIKDFLRTTPLAGCPAARFLRIEHDPLFSRKHLTELRQFTSVPVVTYRVWR